MEFRNIVTFVRVAELQSFTKAGEQLGYSQSAVTVQIRSLEQELGVKLFERIGKRIRLTDEGNRFLTSSLDILKAVENATNNIAIKADMSGTLRIGTVESLLMSVLPPVIQEYSKRYPNVEIQLRTGNLEQVFEMVRQNDIDILYFLGQITNYPDWIKVMEEKQAVNFVASCNHPLSKKKIVTLEELLKYPLISTEKGLSYFNDFGQYVLAKGYELHPCVETGNTDFILNLVRMDVGISFLPDYVTRKDVESGDIVILKTDIPNVDIWSQLVYHKNKWITPQMHAFIDIMKNKGNE